MLIAVAIIGGVLLLLVLISLLSRMAISGMRAPLEARAHRRYAAGEILASEWGANSFGLASRGKLQVRGNGALVLTARELCFFQLTPEEEIVIPLDRITQTSLTRSHLGKATPFKLLKVEFRGDAGDDAIAIMLRNPQAFQAQLDARRGSNSTLQP